MIIGEEIKNILVLLMIAGCLFFCCRDILAQKVEPPSIEDAQSFWQGIKNGIISFFKGFEVVRKGIEAISPFFENIGARICSWWSFQSKPWFEYHWTNLNIYLNQEIKLD